MFFRKVSSRYVLAVGDKLKVKTFEVLGEAYPKRRDGQKQSLLTHSCLVDAQGFATKVLCGKVKLDSIANDASHIHR